MAGNRPSQQRREGTTRIVSSAGESREYSLIVSCAAGVSVVHLDQLRSAVLGRSARCDVVIDDESVSREHARLHLTPEPSIEDLESRNGTTVNEARVGHGERLPLGVGSLVQLGEATVVLQPRRDFKTPANERASASAERSGVVVKDPAMGRLYAMLDVVASSDLPVLLLGETGVGKEVFASELHARSRRKKGPLVTVNCAAIPEPLIEAELFGYEKGAYTGAAHSKMGFFQAADGGTLFLDEIGELPLEVQPKLLRALESGVIARLGTVNPLRVDARIVSATNRDLAASVASGSFRADLLYRLNGIALTIPPLRDRRSEIAPLSRHFVRVACERQGRAPMDIAPDAIVALEQHAWFGNVRELRNTMERAVVLSPGPVLDKSGLIFDAPRGGAADQRVPADQVHSASSSEAHDLRQKMGALEKEIVLEALAKSGGNQTRAAKLLGVGRRTLIDKLDVHEIPGPRKKRNSGRPGED
jgi:two-component system, NtrC family, response regulator AtoC